MSCGFVRLRFIVWSQRDLIYSCSDKMTYFIESRSAVCQLCIMMRDAFAEAGLAGILGRWDFVDR